MRPPRIACACALASLGLGLGACSQDEGASSPEAFCAAIVELGDVEALVASLDPADLVAASDAMDELVAAAPDDVVDDVEQLRDLTAALADAAASRPDDVGAAVEEALRDRADEVAAAGEAGDAVERYVAASCDTDLTSSSTTSTTAPGTTGTITGLD